MFELYRQRIRHKSIFHISCQKRSLTPWCWLSGWWNALVLNLLAGISCKTFRGFSRSSHSLEGDVAPPGNRQLLPTIAMGSREKRENLPPVAWLPMASYERQNLESNWMERNTSLLYSVKNTRLVSGKLWKWWDIR